MIGKKNILDAALSIAQFSNYKNVTRKLISQKIGCAPSTVSYHFETMEKLQTAIMKRAIELNLAAIVAQGIVARDWHALHAPSAVRTAAANSLIAA